MKLYHEVKGNQNKSIIFIHGISQSTVTWDDVISNNELQDRYTLITLDLPGHGNSFRSEEPDKDYTFNRIAKHIANLINPFSEDEYIIVATSLGTNIAAETLPLLKNCKGFFLIGATIIGHNYSPASFLQPNPNAAVAFQSYPSDEQLELYLNDVVQDSKKEKYKQTFLSTDPFFRQTISNIVANSDWTDEIQNITSINLPVAVVYGYDDKIVVTQYLTNSLLNKWRNTIIMIPDAGHSVQLQQPLI